MRKYISIEMVNSTSVKSIPIISDDLVILTKSMQSDMLQRSKKDQWWGQQELD